MWEAQPGTESHPTSRGQQAAGPTVGWFEDIEAPLLVVELTPEDAGRLESSLAPLNQPRVEVSTWREACEALRADDFACVIIDARQGWDAGLDAAHRMRTCEAGRHVPLLLLGATSFEAAQLLSGSSLGRVDFLGEPLAPDLLRVKVRMFIEFYRRERWMRTAIERAEQAEAQARESERMLRTLLGNVPGMVYRCLYEPMWPMTYASEGALPLAGYRPEELTSRRVLWGELVPPEDYVRVWKEIEVAIAARAPFTLVYRIHTRDGAERWMWERGVGVFGPEGEIQCLEGFITDITEFRRVHQEREALLAKRESEHRFLQAVLQQLPVAVHIADAPAGRTLNVNDEAERLLGHSMFDTQSVAEFVRYRAVHADGRRYAAEDYPIARVLASGKADPPHELLYDRPDGSLRTFHIGAGPVWDQEGKLCAVVASFMDITELKRTERDQSFLAAVSQELAGSLDYEATLARVARQALPRLGDGCALDVLEPDGSIRRLALAHVDPAREALMWEVARDYPILLDAPYGSGVAISTGTPQWLVPVTDEVLLGFAQDARHLDLIRRIGCTSWLVVPLHARDRTFGALGFFFGRPERQHDAVDMALAEDLARRAALAVDNARLYGEVQTAVRQRDEFLSVASHELKTPLTPLNLTLSSLSRELHRSGGRSGAQGERLAHHLDTARRQVQKLATLVGALFDVSRLSQGKLTLESEQLDLAEVVKEVGAWFAPEAARAGSELRVDCQTPARGWWDRLRLEQVVTNLLSNAIRYGAGRPILARVDCDGRVARLVVRDEGIGISPEALGRIFDKFERATSERHYGGLGLGLYITRGIVEAMGGHIRVESQLGRGSTFTVELPCVSPPDARAARTVPPM